MIEIIAANVVLVIAAYVLRSPSAFILSIVVRMALGALLLKYFSGNHRQVVESGGCNFRALLGFGVPYQATTALSMIQKSMNPIIVGSLVGVSAVGFVNWSTYIVSLPLLPLQPLYAFLFSVVSERQRQGEDDNETIQVLLRIGLVLMSLLSMVFILVLPSLVTHIFGRQWREALPIASVLLLGNTAIFHSSVITTHLTAKGHSKIWMQIVMVESILIWVMGGLGTVTFGLIGYASGLLGASVAVLAIQCSLVKKLTGLNVLFSDSIRLIIIIALSIFVSRLGVSYLSKSELWEGMLSVVFAVSAFSGILVLTDAKRLSKDFEALVKMINFRSCSLGSVP
jgi:O-antigen/teichoic acid export membrane protein